ncbi:MAG: cell envelope integrity protein TolA [Woeseiaceae bacterium]|nr:cell envelope integrity protein TolA [Woeseiaceae bacterium]
MTAAIRDRFNIIPATFAVLLHVVLVGSFYLTFDWTRRTPPAVPLAIEATLVTDSAVVIPPPPIEQEPVADPEPEIVEPPPPDPAELERARLEEEKRQADLRAEQERIRLEEEAEAKRQAELEAERKAEEEAEREAERERQLEEQRRLAELKRQEDIRRQREENERQRLALEQEQRNAALAAEEEAMAARSSPEMALYISQISNKIQRNWIRPTTAPDDLECVVRVSQLPSGEVLRVDVTSCNAGDVVARSVEAAVRKASPLPLPANPLLFTRELRLTFRVQQ